MNSCVAPKCEDGYVRSGVEQCDDANAIDQDGCSPSCQTGPLCSDPTGDRRVLAGDALRLLQRAVSLDVECPDWTCDTNGDGKVSAADALITLSAPVGLYVFNDKPTRVLSMSMVDLVGFAGPREIARCNLTPTGIIQTDALVTKILDALSPAGTTVLGVQVKAIPY